MPAPSLPIWQIHADIVGALTHGNRLVLVAPTGSGKTTQVPQMLLEAGLAGPPPPSITVGGESFGPSVTIPIGLPMAEAEDRIVAAALDQCGGDKEKAAKLLGISSRTLYRRFSKTEE